MDDAAGPAAPNVLPVAWRPTITALAGLHIWTDWKVDHRGTATGPAIDLGSTWGRNQPLQQARSKKSPCACANAWPIIIIIPDGGAGLDRSINRSSQPVRLAGLPTHAPDAFVMPENLAN